MDHRAARRDRPDLTNYTVSLFNRGYAPTDPRITNPIINNNKRSYAEFLLSALDYADPSSIEARQWEPSRMLGAGTFGNVGLWVKRDPATNTIVDELALKEVRRDAAQEWRLNINAPALFPGLTREAVLQAQLNDFNSPNIAHLRRYKYYPGRSGLPGRPAATDGSEGKYRMYLEFAPHTTLSHLHARYTIWEKHFPELFLWHVFNSLAKALVVLEQGPPTHFFTGQAYDPSWGVLHMDLKMENVLLGRPEEDVDFTAPFNPESEYPSVQLTDFGASDVTGPGDRSNPDQYWWRVTHTYRPLEHALYNDPPHIYGSDFTTPPNGRPFPRDEWNQAAYGRDPGFQFTSAHNVGSLGKIMWDMIYLAQQEEFHLVAANQDDEILYNAAGQHAIPPISVRERNNEIYTRELRELIRECCRASASLRPTPTAVLAFTTAGLDRRRPRSTSSTVAAHHRVYYAGSDINAMPRGDMRFNDDHDHASLEELWRYVNTQDYSDPRAPALRPPGAKWVPIIPRFRGSKYSQYRQVQGRDVDFDKEGKMFFVGAEDEWMNDWVHL